MDRLGLKNTRIDELVEKNYVHGYVLFYLGIRFYEYSELTLGQVCKQRGLKVV
jgi:regulator of cell morphogenesis and NO signaling